MIPPKPAKPMREYVVTVETCSGATTDVLTFARDRGDAIEFVKRNNKTRFWRKEYVKVVGARLLQREQLDAAG